jgi:hypothetical protein
VTVVVAFLTELYCVAKIQVRLKLNGSYQPLVYADDVNLPGDNIDTINNHTETLFDASKKADLEVNTEKTKYTLLSRHQSKGQTHDIKIVNRFFENAAQYKYLRRTVTNQN